MDIKINDGFFETVSEQLSLGHFNLIDQIIVKIDECTKRIDNTYVLSSDAVDTDGKVLRAGKDKISISDYTDEKPGHKLLFIDENNPQHLAWAQAQGGNASWFVNDPTNVSAPKEAPVAQISEFTKSNFDLKELPCCVTTNGSSYYVTKIHLENGKGATLH